MSIKLTNQGKQTIKRFMLDLFYGAIAAIIWIGGTFYFLWAWIEQGLS